MTKKQRLIDTILKRIAAECPFPPSDYYLETTREVLLSVLK